MDVSDGGGDAALVLFDTDCSRLLKKQCKELVMRSKVGLHYFFIIHFLIVYLSQ